MNWDALGSIAEILGAAGVIASLLYLSRQIRQSTEATRLAMSHSLATAVRDWNRPLLEDASLARAFQLGVEDPSQLDEAQRSRFMQLCFSFFRMFEDMHYQFRNGSLSAEVWESYAKQYGAYAKAPGLVKYWELRRDLHQPEFQQFLDSYVPPTMVRVDEIVRRTGPGNASEPGAV